MNFHKFFMKASIEEIKNYKGVADVNIYSDTGSTALITAICAGNYELVKVLIELGCDVNKPDKFGGTPLWFAEVDFGLLDIANLLREHGARMTDEEIQHG